MTAAQHIRIGTRASKLALWQARSVQAALEKQHPTVTFELVEVSSHGDRDRTTPLSQMGSVGIFTKLLEEALLNDEIDLAVHSLKDMPTALPPGLALSAFLAREDPRDALISRGARSVAELKNDAVVATGSIRRRAQIAAQRRDIRFTEVRGNIETRLNKFHASDWDAMILASAGLTRLGLTSHIAAALEPAEILPAVGQGIMTVEQREGEQRLSDLLSPINDAAAEAAGTAERAMMRRLEGGCQVPIGAFTDAGGDTLNLQAAVVSLDGSRSVRDSVIGSRDDAERLGVELAERLLAQGAEPILAEIRHPRSEA